MIPHKRLFKHDPENGVYGDCQRTNGGMMGCPQDRKEPFA